MIGHYINDVVVKELKIAGEAPGLLGCVLKIPKIFMKFYSAGPVVINEPNFDQPLFPKFEAP